MRQIGFLALWLLAYVSFAEEGNHATPASQARQSHDRRMQALTEYYQRIPNERYDALVKRLARDNPYVLELRQAFPNAYQISSRGLESGPPKICENGNPLDRFVFVAPLHGRYTLRMFVPFCLAKDLAEVEFHAEPYFDIWELISIKPTGRGEQVRIHCEPVFGEDGGNIVMRAKEWKRLRDANQDWSVVDISLKTNSPVEGFETTLPKAIAPNNSVEDIGAGRAESSR